jgi:peptidoglycan/xylan/chitin deacetylase (PgdA/CDA1 family)
MHIPLSILRYGRIVATPDPLFPELPDVRAFTQHLRWLQRWCRVLPLGTAVRRLRAGTLPARSVCLTFDGAFAEYATVALPLLQRAGVRATFFVASGQVDGPPCWREALTKLVRSAPGPRLCLARAGFGSFDIGCMLRRRAVLDLLLAALAGLPPAERMERIRALTGAPRCAGLSADQLIALHRAGMEIGANTVSAQALATLSNADARAEIADSRRQLEQIVHAPVTLFAYPEGKPGTDFERRHGHMLRSAGFEAAVTTAGGAARAGTDPYELPRTRIHASSSTRFLLRLGRNLLQIPDQTRTTAARLR